jgi:hypothetical protein
MDFDKYNPLNSQPAILPSAIPGENDLSLTSWQDSAAVIRLSEYLKKHPAQGIKLCRRRSTPVMSFYPGLLAGDLETERWRVANAALELFLDALDDLTKLLSRSLIDLPHSTLPSLQHRINPDAKSKRCAGNLTAESTAGPSQALLPYAGAEAQNLATFRE